MKKDNELLLWILAIIAWGIWLVIVAKNPPSYEDMTVQERIRYEQMIFP